MKSLVLTITAFILLMSGQQRIAAQERSAPSGELIFPLEGLHNHGSCIVELPNGDLLTCWYRGHGERTADDCAIMGSRLKRDSKAWSPMFVMADTPDLPDTNPCMTVDAKGRLWLIWPTILDNLWESALLKVRISSKPGGNGAPNWDGENVAHLKPGPEFLETVKRDLDKQWNPIIDALPSALKARLTEARSVVMKRAETKLSQRLGWMPRAHPIWLDTETLMLPLYSDGFSFSLMAFTKDGQSWTVSTPLVGPANVQPTVARRKDRTLVAFFRDNGPPPKRVQVSESTDEGKTWTLSRDTDVPDPGAGLEVTVLKDGSWILLHNHTENGRHQLAVAVSRDEGRTWPTVKYLEQDDPKDSPGSYSYPSVTQTRDGAIHVTYSFKPSKKAAEKTGKGETIKHMRFLPSWLNS